ncbi:MAG TPA: substrate-binding domain-containing protein [Candidatus Limiplasma sp.]|nr:substrate-binding domain-containing protein [Candidatus Limiplasma sp.]
MKRLLTLIVAVVLVLGTYAIASADVTGEGLYIGVVYKQSGNAYFQAAVTGFEQAAEELGFTFDHDGPEDGSNDGQIRIIQNFIDKGVDVLCVSANDPNGLVDVLQAAREEGIKVVSWDAEVSAEARDLDVQPASAKAIGLQLLESIAASIGYEGQIAVVSAGATAANQNLWISYIEEALKDDPTYANIEYLGVVYGDDEYQKSYDVTLALLHQYPDIKGLIVPTTVGGPAVSKCVMDENMTGKVKVTGLTLASDMAEYIKAGVCDETFLWNPIELGYVTSYAACALVNGDITGAVGDTLAVPGFEGLEVTESSSGGTILYLNKLNPFTVDTVDDWVNIL